MSDTHDSTTLDISGLDPAEILASLHNNTRAQGLGIMHDIGRELQTSEAVQLLAEWSDGDGAYKGSVRFDYLMGRPLKVKFDFDKGTLERIDLYNRDAGVGKAERIIEDLRRQRTTEV